MNAQERTLLNESVRADPPVTLLGTVKWLLIWTIGLTLCGGLLGLMFMSEHLIVSGIVAVPVTLAAIICLGAIIMLIASYLRWSRYHRDFVRRDIPEIKTALDDGRVFVKRVVAEAVIEIIEFEDEGSGYIYDIGGGKTLYLKGQRFFPVHEEMAWPNSEFEIVRTVHRNIWVGIFCSGHELMPFRKLESSDCVDEFVWAEREDVMDGNIQQFAASIMKAAKPTGKSTKNR